MIGARKTIKLEFSFSFRLLPGSPYVLLHKLLVPSLLIFDFAFFFSSFSIPFSVCPIGKFKPHTGDELCRSCPAHSKSSYRGATECRCDAGYYRSPKDPKGMPCTRKYSLCCHLVVISELTFALSFSSQNHHRRHKICPPTMSTKRR